MYALPLLSSILDLSGQVLLVAAFSITRHFAPKIAEAVAVITLPP